MTGRVLSRTPVLSRSSRLSGMLMAPSICSSSYSWGGHLDKLCLLVPQPPLDFISSNRCGHRTPLFDRPTSRSLPAWADSGRPHRSRRRSSLPPWASGARRSLRIRRRTGRRRSAFPASQCDHTQDRTGQLRFRGDAHESLLHSGSRHLWPGWAIRWRRLRNERAGRP